MRTIVEKQLTVAGDVDLDRACVVVMATATRPDANVETSLEYHWTSTVLPKASDNGIRCVFPGLQQYISYRFVKVRQQPKTL